MQHFHIRVIEGNHQRAVVAVFHAQLPADPLHHLGAAHVERRFQRALLCVKACVHDGGIGGTCRHCHVLLCLHNADIQPISAERARDQRADHTGTYHHNIKHDSCSFLCPAGELFDHRRADENFLSGWVFKDSITQKNALLGLFAIVI